MYIVFPLSPTVVLYCKDRGYWKLPAKFENAVSPVAFTTAMVQHENSGQVGLSYRFIFSAENDFQFAEKFLRANPEFSNPERMRFEK